MIKTLLKTLWPFFLLASTASLALAGPMSQSELPMSQPNFQGFVPENRNRDEREEDPNLVRLMIHPTLTEVADKLLDEYQAQNPDSRFRIHQGSQNDLLDLIEDNYTFDLLLDAEIAEGMEMVEQGRAVETRVLALGRVALWAPLETVRSINVLSLRDDKIGLHHESSPYHRAGKEILERHELLEDYRSRLEAVPLGTSLYQKVNDREIPAAFIEYHRIVQAGIQRRREVLKMPADHHGSITHSATLMREGADRDRVMNFWEYLFSDSAQKILEDAGFD
ncbi:substrate-binding domain-containing protein [Marinospirillum sp.]|uniref:molybdate ABC transporter substrate-binding protein n=1 Tax=Marinospirillum sp. TaxID=2183934 RepID=UPI002870A1C8|nr:substrate-binding domain-containing protein [Marinospirillum sp.]MDR9469010.1 substrate-binding domain-containing protein [Marinospirillum sp.]